MFFCMTCSGFKLCSRSNARIALFHALVDCDEDLTKTRNEGHERTHLESGIDSKMAHDGDCVVISLVSRVELPSAPLPSSNVYSHSLTCFLHALRANRENA